MTHIVRMPKWYDIRNIFAFDASLIGCTCFHSQHVSMKEYMSLNLATILCDVVLGLALFFYVNSLHISPRGAYISGMMVTVIVSLFHYAVSKYFEHYFFVRNAWKAHVGINLMQVAVNR